MLRSTYKQYKSVTFALVNIFMQTRLIVIYSLFMVWALGTVAQVPDLYMVNIKGVITSAENNEPVPYAHVINVRVHGGTTTNADGRFSITMLTEDTLIIRAVGFVDQKMTINEFPPKNLYEIVMKPVRYLLDEITVTGENQMRRKLGLPDAKPLNIPTELRGAAFNEKPPWYAAFLSPLSFLQYHLGSEEKQKRETLVTIKNNEEWMKFSRFFNLETITRLTGLEGKDADQFMVYCNLNNRLPYFAGQMEVEFQIMDLYFKYKREQTEELKD